MRNFHLFAETIQTQNCQISELRSEILTLRQTRIEETNKFDALGTKIEYNLSKMLENYLNRYEREHNKKLEAFLTGRYGKYLIFALFYI